MGNDRLNGLALLNVHSDTQYIPSVLEVKAEFLLKKRRLLESTLIDSSLAVTYIE